MFEETFGLSGSVRIKHKGNAVHVYDKQHQARCVQVGGKLSDCKGCREGEPIAPIDPDFIAHCLKAFE